MTLSNASPLVACFVLLLTASHLSSVRGYGEFSSPILEPKFAEPVPNITAAVGRPATLTCVVDNLGNYRLAWIHKEQHMLLTLQDKVITRNPRVSIRTDSPKRTWWLRIDEVQKEDAGNYMCQVNTAPMMSNTGILLVVVPPSIDEEWTSSDLEIREGSDVNMKCRATGSPVPEIHWRREYDRNIIFSPSEAVPSFKGESLSLRRTSRLSMGAYFCIASNGVQPSVSKRIMLNVLFPPMVILSSQLIGASVGEDISLLCHLESNPRSITYWLLSDGILIISNNKYRVQEKPDPSLRAYQYKVEMELKILDLRPQDFGSYTCVAKNSLGETQEIINLYEKPSPYTRPPVKQQYMETTKYYPPLWSSPKPDFVKATRTEVKNVKSQVEPAGAIPGEKGHSVANGERDSGCLTTGGWKVALFFSVVIHFLLSGLISGRKNLM